VPPVRQRTRRAIASVSLVAGLITPVGPAASQAAGQPVSPSVSKVVAGHRTLSLAAVSLASPTSHAFQVGSKVLDYCGNGSVAVKNKAVTRIVVVVHGTSGNYCDYARYAMESASDAGVLGSTLVIAPHFVTSAETSDQSRLIWGSGWREGNTSNNADDTKVSSFTALDQLAAAARRTYGASVPLRLVGHSAGGQFVQRYAEGSDAPVDRFVAANPSSYAYLSARRWIGGTAVTSVPGCAEYDTWKYGLQGLNGYMRSAGDIRARYAGHRVALLLGGADVLRDSELDVGCEADAQGRNRLERGQAFFTRLPDQLGFLPTGHSLAVVPGVGHDGRSMIRSAAARALLFG
jgi:pimeloyl-ACP methyl ester carboxylesterase